MFEGGMGKRTRPGVLLADTPLDEFGLEGAVAGVAAVCEAGGEPNRCRSGGEHDPVAFDGVPEGAHDRRSSDRMDQGLVVQSLDF